MEETSNQAKRVSFDCPATTRQKRSARSSRTDFISHQLVALVLILGATVGTATPVSTNGCPALTNPAFGSVTVTSSLPGGQATFSCNSGYGLKGVKDVVCTGNGTWDVQTPPTCRPLACPTGTVNWADKSCFGVYPMGDMPYAGAVTLCGRNGQLPSRTTPFDLVGRMLEATGGEEFYLNSSGGGPHKQPSFCNRQEVYVRISPEQPCRIRLPVVLCITNHTAASCKGYGSYFLFNKCVNVITQLLTYSAANQYCQNLGGKWSSRTDFSDSEYTRIYYQTGMYKYRLRAFNIQGRRNGTCSSVHVSDWVASGTCDTPKKVVCTAPLQLTCPDPQLPHLVLLGTALADEVGKFNVSCSAGSRVDRTDAYCNKAGDWDGLPTCEQLKCVDPGAMGRPHLNPTSAGLTATFSCSQGFSMVGKATVQCNLTGQWAAPLPTCKENCFVDDPTVTKPTNGSCPLTMTPHEHIEQGSCPVSRFTYCFQTNRGLTGQQYRHLQLMIKHPDSYQAAERHCHGHLPGMDHLHGTKPALQAFHNDIFALPWADPKTYKVRFWLKNGYYYDAENDVTGASPPGQHHPITFIVCVTGAYCTDPGSPNRVKLPLTDAKRKATFTCRNGFVLFGQHQVECYAHEQWKSALPKCIVGCFAPSSPRRAPMQPTPAGHVANFTCLHGISLIGPRQVQCRSDGKWAGPLPICEARFLCQHQDHFYLFQPHSKPFETYHDAARACHTAGGVLPSAKLTHSQCLNRALSAFQGEKLWLANTYVQVITSGTAVHTQLTTPGSYHRVICARNQAPCVGDVQRQDTSCGSRQMEQLIHPEHSGCSPSTLSYCLRTARRLDGIFSGDQLVLMSFGNVLDQVKHSTASTSCNGTLPDLGRLRSVFAAHLKAFYTDMKALPLFQGVRISFWLDGATDTTYTPASDTIGTLPPNSVAFGVCIKS